MLSCLVKGHALYQIMILYLELEKKDLRFYILFCTVLIHQTLDMIQLYTTIISFFICITNNISMNFSCINIWKSV